MVLEWVHPYTCNILVAFGIGMSPDTCYVYVKVASGTWMSPCTCNITVAYSIGMCPYTCYITVAYGTGMRCYIAYGTGMSPHNI